MSHTESYVVSITPAKVERWRRIEELSRRLIRKMRYRGHVLDNHLPAEIEVELLRLALSAEAKE